MNVKAQPAKTSVSKQSLWAPSISNRSGRTWFYLVVSLLSLLLVLAVLGSLAVGARHIPIPEVLHAVLHRDTQDTATTIVWDRRVPRTLLALLSGAALGVAGVFIQALTRNPLADTGVLGINAGAAFTALLAIAFLGFTSPIGYLLAALVGAVLTSAAVYAISRGRSMGVDPVRLVLAGVALSAILAGIGEGLSLVNPQAFDRLRSWMVGSVDIGSYTSIPTTASAIGAGLVAAALCAPQLNTLVLGDETAVAVGARVDRVRFFCFVVVVVLAASATAAVGVIAFLGLVVPHLARWLVGANYVRIFAVSLLLGPLLLLCADIFGRVIVAGELPAGVVVSFIGAPFLIGYAQTAQRGL